MERRFPITIGENTEIVTVKFDKEDTFVNGKKVEKILNKRVIIIIGDDLKSLREKMMNMNHYLNDLLPDDHEVFWFPENGLHPWEHMKWLEHNISEIQDENHGLIIFTNSSYIIDHMVNLMAGVYDRSYNAKFLLTTNPGSFIPVDQVEVFEFKEDRLIDILDHEKGHIDWSCLSKPADWNNDVFFKINNGDDDA